MSDVPDTPPPGAQPPPSGRDGAAPDTPAPDPSVPGPGPDEQAADGPEGEGSEDAGSGGLSARDVAVLAVERRGWPGPGAKERAVRERLGMSPTRYYQLLNALLDDPRALAHDPVTVNRLRRIRQADRDAR